MKILTLDEISISFGTREILKNVSLSADTGSIIAITGKTGSGKTTLLGIIAGMLKPKSGSVAYRGYDIFRWSDFKRSRYRNRNIGFVYQSFNLLPHLTASQNIAYPALINHKMRDISSHLKYLVEYLELQECIDQLPAALSGGEKQRVALARAIINSPDIVLADEPTGNLDERTVKRIFALFQDLREKGMLVLVATHDRHIIRNADSRFHLEEGRLIRKR
jgi:ABC-type lipoprotein export system ATPase subunit